MIVDIKRQYISVTFSLKIKYSPKLVTTDTKNKA